MACTRRHKPILGAGGGGVKWRSAFGDAWAGRFVVWRRLARPHRLAPSIRPTRPGCLARFGAMGRLDAVDRRRRGCRAAPLAAASPDPALRRVARGARRPGAAARQDPHHLPDARLLATAHRALSSDAPRRGASFGDAAAAAGAAERLPAALPGAVRAAP